MRIQRLLALLLLFAASSAVAQQPPLIDRDLFFGDPEISGAQISPDGRFISFRKQHRDVMNIWVKGVDEPFDAARPLTADTTRPVSGYFWSRDSRYVLYVQDKGGNENYHVYAVDPTGAIDPATGTPAARDLTPYENVRAQIYSVPRATPNTIMVGLNDRDAQLHDVYRVDLATGERTLIIENNENVAGWQFDETGRLRLGVRVAPTGSTEILRVGEDGLVPIYDCTVEESCGPLRFERGTNRIYMLTNKGNDVDLTRLIFFDVETGAEEFIESDPEGQADFSGAAFSDVTGELLATVYVGDRVRIYPKTDAFERELASLRAKLPEGEISLGASTADERRWIVSVSRDVDPGSAYLYDRETGEVELLYRSRPSLPSEHLASMEPVRYRARDGLEIPAYLTLPKGLAEQGLPVIIVPHGGPWARDMWGYDPYTQFLANRGYAVLQPNFRGSTGYGKAFLNAGNKEWGTGAMQHDISDGVSYLIERGIADPERVGIFGGSYGGYATLAGLAFTPELYAAGVSYVGPSNLLTLLKSIPPYWAPIKKIFDARLGNADDPEDRERLERQSPLNSADAINAPLLVIQGANDPRVNQAESDQIVVALRDKGHPVEYLVAPDEGHGFAGRENRLATAAQMERFLAKHLGGRYQESMPPEIGAKLAALTVDVATVTLATRATAADAPAVVASDGSRIQPVTLEYHSTVQVQGQELNITSTREVTAATFEGRAIWRVVDQSEMRGMAASDTTEMDRATLLPVRRSASGQGNVKLRYSPNLIEGEIRAGPQTIPVKVETESPAFGDGAGLEVAFAGLPLKPGYEATVQTFNLIMQRVRTMRLSVTGTETVTCAAGTYETYVVKVEPLDDEPGGTATIHVMREGPHYAVRSTVRLPAMMGGGEAKTELAAMTAGTN
jgi:dipeptidyl aminopeptidase/acylaminoacyl peptidase